MRPLTHIRNIAVLALAFLFPGVLGAAETPAAAPSLKLTASSLEKPETPAGAAMDGDLSTRWSSQFRDREWLQIDFGEVREISGLVLHWEQAHAAKYRIEVLVPGTDKPVWKPVFEETACDGGTDYVIFEAVKTTKVRLSGVKRATTWGYSLLEIEVIEAKDAPRAESQGNAHPEFATDGRLDSAWKGSGDITFEMNGVRPVGGIFIHWGAAFPAAYAVEVMPEGTVDWKKVFETKTGNGKTDKVYIDSVPAEKIRIVMGGAGPYEIQEVAFKGGDEAISPQKYYEVLAEEAPRGFFPRWLYKEQIYWTVAGAPGGEDTESLLAEDGSVEPYQEGFMISPFVAVNGKIFTAEDVKTEQSLEGGYLPVPKVVWSGENFRFEVEIFGWGEASKAATYVRYKLVNTGDAALEGNLYLAARPLQINPPWQHGGMSTISNMAYQPDKLSFQVNSRERIVLGRAPDELAVVGHDRGEITEKIRAGDLSGEQSAKDPSGLVSGAWSYGFKLEKGAEASWDMALSLHFSAPHPDPSQFEEFKAAALDYWERTLNRFEIQIPEQRLVDIYRSNLAYILINQDGPALQPGSRNYERSWIRDGSAEAAALLQAGITEEVKNFLDWYSGFVEENGEVPAVISTAENQRDRIKEYDSQGQFIFSVLQYYRYSGDEKWLLEKYPLIRKALQYLMGLRLMRLTEAYPADDPDKGRFRGILPESVSHEGYFPEPGKHSYWDDFWALRGWKDGRAAARLLGSSRDVEWMTNEEETLRRSVLDSIEKTAAFKRVDYIPGSAELGDFDATSTAIAVYPCDEFRSLPAARLKRTFDVYFQGLAPRLQPGWKGSFTPYELRSVQAMLYMGRKQDAWEMLRYFLTVVRPSGWNHWAEVVFGDERLAQYLGDMPHTWVGASFLNAFRALFVYEMDDRLILGHGLDPVWLESEEGVKVRLPTEFGEVRYEIKKAPAGWHVSVDGTAKPPHGFVFKSPAGKDEVFQQLPAEFNLESQSLELEKAPETPAP